MHEGCSLGVREYSYKTRGDQQRKNRPDGTVYGDVHDIGKNLVKTILVNNGYEVFDLGKQVPIPTIVSKIKEVTRMLWDYRLYWFRHRNKCSFFRIFARE